MTEQAAKYRLTSAICVLLWGFVNSAHGQMGVYMETEDFLETAFPDSEPEVSVIWINNERREVMEEILEHPVNALRISYWVSGDTTAWILDEIGKDKPITIGVVVQGDAIKMIRVLVFREIRGWEVRHPFFTDQFLNSQLTREERQGVGLDRTIDNITGATLSVNALRGVSEIVLFLVQESKT
ncbi:MAG: FMN-binding protein [Gammaproteobacteria bacterium]|nr:FMN-binding protein [Gammaproteobacteria bacterium]